jgi:uncharacterized protein YaiI (UPF0178 family)
MLTIFIDADGCPVKDETYKVATRYGLSVWVVANKYQKTPPSPLIKAIVVEQGFDKADDWIAEHAGAGDIVVTADIPLAGRCIANGASAIGPKGREFTPDSIGNSLATRALMDQLRQMGEMTGGPAPMGQKDRSRFLSSLDELVNRIRNNMG